MRITPQLIESLNRRLERARALAQQGQVYPISGQPNTYAVVSSDGREAYLVQLGDDPHCSCPDYARLSARGLRVCKHLLACQLHEPQEVQTALQATETPEPNPPARNGRTRARSRPATAEPLQDPPIPTPEQLAGSLHDPD